MSGKKALNADFKPIIIIQILRPLVLIVVLLMNIIIVIPWTTKILTLVFATIT
jgi:hypothetical protein